MLLQGVSVLVSYYLVVPTVVVLSNIQKNIPLCPQKQARELDYPYVVYGNNPARCYVASRQGPCSEGSILFAKPKSHFGVCSCECFLGDGIIFDDYHIERYRYCFSKQMGSVFVYDKKRCDCYQLGSQGPCPDGHVLHKDIYEQDPKCVREEMSNQPHTPIEQERCPPGTIYSTLLNICTDMNFRGLSNSTTSGTTQRPTGNRCPPGTIYSELLNICTDMNFHGLSTTTSSGGTTNRPTGNTCPPGTIYSELLNICTDMNFHGLKPTGQTTTRPVGRRCPPGTIYSTLLNICTDMNFRGLSNHTSGSTSTVDVSRRCPEGTIYSTLLNICTDMNFRGLRNHSSSATSTINGSRKCPEGTIYSTLLNTCTDMSFRGLKNNSL